MTTPRDGEVNADTVEDLDRLPSPQSRSSRLGSKVYFCWEQNYTAAENLSRMNKPLRKYYEHNNYLISQFLEVDRLLQGHARDAEHNDEQEGEQDDADGDAETEHVSSAVNEPRKSKIDENNCNSKPCEHTQHLYSISTGGTPVFSSTEDTPLLSPNTDWSSSTLAVQDIEASRSSYSPPWPSSTISTAIGLTLSANTILLAGKIAVALLTSSLSVFASLVDGALDFVSTAIVLATTRAIARQDQSAYPAGRRRLEPLGVLVFGVVMVTAFVQVGIACLTRLVGELLADGDGAGREVVQLGWDAISIMLATVVIKGGCWAWCRSIKNSSIQALAQDALTDGEFGNKHLFRSFSWAIAKAAFESCCSLG